MFSVGKKAYRVISPFEYQYGTVVKIQPYFNASGRNWITIRLKDGTEVGDYESNFSRSFPAACKYFNSYAERRESK